MKSSSPFAAGIELPTSKVDIVKPGPQSTKWGHFQDRNKNRSEVLDVENGYPNVLIIDDDKFAAELISRQLASKKLNTKIISSFEDGFTGLLKTCDLVVLDWMLDKKTGGQLIESIERLFECNGISKKIPIVTYSTLPMESMYFGRLHRFEYIDHIQKPLKKHDIDVALSKVGKAFSGK